MKHNLNISSWNIQGLRTKLHGTNSTLGASKLNIKLIQNIIKQHDIICLQETWQKHENLCFTGYSVYSTVQETKSKRGCRGVAILVKNTISSFVKILPYKNPNILWCVLDKNSFGLEDDIYLASVYLPPLQCQKKCREDIMSILEQDIIKYKDKGEIMLLGDFNARTGIHDDYIKHDDDGSHITDEEYIVDETCPKRNNSDLFPNKQGHNMLDICITHRLRILNGRTSGDLMGNYTCYQANGASTIDYSIVSYSLWKDILAFHVQNLTPYSDHCPIFTKLATKISISQMTSTKAKNQNHKNKNSIKKFVWSEDANVKFTEALQSTHVQSLIEQLSQTDNIDIHEHVNKFNDIIKTAASLSLKTKSAFRKTISKTKNKKWYTDECKYLKKKLKELAKNINTSNYNTMKTEYYTLKKKYKRIIKKSHRQYKNTIISKINNLSTSESSQFWKELRDLRNSDQDNTTPVEITEETWVDHFKTLLQDNTETSYENSEPYISKSTDALDTEITKNEIETHINKLKTKKSPGIDGILNEMIKSGRYILVPIIKTLFNKILISGTFPQIWNKGLIKTIYKKGDKLLPSNYRGITLTSCLGKLFTSILQTRLMNYLENNKLLCAEQFGFRRNSRTTDNLFILKQLIQSHFRANKKLYVAFVDYEKAFDTVWQSGLLHKIKKLGITNNFYKVIESMYNTVTSSVILENDISESFPCNKGIRQGDGLSPLLFSIFMNDLPAFLKTSGCKGVQLNTTLLNCLMFADDLVLLSSSPSDLQHSINALGTHAKTWKLKVNSSKTKVMIFNKQGRLINDTHFMYNQTQCIDIVHEQTYLGINLVSSGKYSNTRETLCKKGLKVLGTIRRMLSNCDFIPINTYNKLFDTIVKPVIMYASEIWGPELLQYKTLFEKSCHEQLHLKFCKILLGIPWYASNNACRAELGRYPLKQDIQSNIYTYYLRLKHNACNPLLKEAFHWSMSQPSDFTKICFDLDAKVMTQNRSSYQQPILKHEMKIKRKEILDILKKEYQNRWTMEKANSSSTFVNQFKNTYTYEHYLSLVKNSAHRILLTKLRLGTHTLRIQTGKYENKGGPIPVNQRTCIVCKTDSVDNEEHFIGHCQTFSHIRTKYFKHIAETDTSFSSLNTNKKIQYILEANNHHTCALIGKYVSDLFAERKKYIK